MYNPCTNNVIFAKKFACNKKFDVFSSQTICGGALIRGESFKGQITMRRKLDSGSG